jgi:hypothetical protein
MVMSGGVPRFRIVLESDVFEYTAWAGKICPMRGTYSALYFRAAALSRELALGRADGSLRHFLARLSRIDVRSSMTGPWRH